MSAEVANYCIQFYVSIVAYFILHMIFVIASDFVDAFNIPPLNIGIYVDKLAAIRALLMVLADIIEWGSLDKGAGDYSMDTALKDKISELLKTGQGSRRVGSIFSFLVMLSCRMAYLILVYTSDNKSLSVFVTLCIEGFWFGVFQMSFFAIGPKYNAATSLGIHTMGNFIFFFQLILNKLGKSYPGINPLSRVRAHAWICFVNSVLALAAWLYFCIMVTAADDKAKLAWQLKQADVQFPSAKGQNVKPVEQDSVWSPFWLFIVGAFAEDFSVPGILPFAFLDPEKANLVNYLTPLFFMTGAVITFFLNDIFGGAAGLTGNRALNSRFKEWSANVSNGMAWHGLWAMNLPKYIAFFIAMWAIHGTFGRLRCIVQCRWRVMLLTMTVVIPRAWLETAGYVGVANYALGLFAASGFQDGDSNNWGGTKWEEFKGELGDVGKKHMMVLCDNSTDDMIEHGEEQKKHNEHPDHKGHVKIPKDGSEKWYKWEGANSSGLMFIAFHDMVAMFCRFVYGMFDIRYNTTNKRQ